jgi:hypothetical protein
MVTKVTLPGMEQVQVWQPVPFPLHAGILGGLVCKQCNEKQVTPHLTKCGRKRRLDGRKKTTGRQAF